MKICIFTGKNSHVTPIDLSGLKQVRDFFWSLTCLRQVCDLLKTCRKPGFKQVLSKIDVMEFGLIPVTVNSIWYTMSQKTGPSTHGVNFVKSNRWIQYYISNKMHTVFTKHVSHVAITPEIKSSSFSKCRSITRRWSYYLTKLPR